MSGTGGLELWGADRVARHLGIGLRSVAVTLKRWKVAPVVPSAGRRGAQYSAAQVREAAASRPRRRRNSDTDANLG